MENYLSAKPQKKKKDLGFMENWILFCLCFWKICLETGKLKAI